jgi:flagellar biosynthesis protein FlhG
VSLICCVSSGKGGVGKTLSSVYFAVSLKKAGKSVLIIDGDVGLSNVDVVLGIRPTYNILDVLEGRVNPMDALADGPHGLKVLHGGSGIAQLSNLLEVEKLMFFSHIRSLADNFDVTIIDAGAGISPTIIEMNRISDLRIVVTTPESHAMTDAYALIKMMTEARLTSPISLLINQSRTPDEGDRAYERIANVSEKFLGVKPYFLGSVPSDPQVSALLRQRRGASSYSLQTIAGSAWAKISHKFSEALSEPLVRGNVPGLVHNLEF